MAGVKSKVDKSEVDKILAGYKDSTKISAWPREQAALCVKEKIFVGNDGQLRPQEQINRAEIATIIARLLVQSKLVS
ncbi:MAG: S-layer homology domain-containing protein [Carboxydocellales bacterium]